MACCWLLSFKFSIPKPVCWRICEGNLKTCHFHCNSHHANRMQNYYIYIVWAHFECLDNFSGHRTDYVPIIAYVSQDFNWIWRAPVPPIIICELECKPLFYLMTSSVSGGKRANNGYGIEKIKIHISLDFSFRFRPPSFPFQRQYRSTHAWRIEFTFWFAIIIQILEDEHCRKLRNKIQHFPFVSPPTLLSAFSHLPRRCRTHLFDWLSNN